MILPPVSYNEALSILTPLLYFIGGMVVYTIFIFNFYRYLAKKDLFELDLSKYAETSFAGLKKFFSIIVYLVEYVLITPLLVFFWFVILSILLAFLSKSQDPNNILLVAMAVVSTVRITAYYHEDLSRDVAKILPFTLLGIFLVDISFFSLEKSIDLLLIFPTLWSKMMYFLLFAIVLEFVLRILYGLKSIFGKSNVEEEKKRIKT